MDTLYPDNIPIAIAIPIVIVLLLVWAFLELRAKKKQKREEKLAAFTKAVEYCEADAKHTMALYHAMPKYEGRITK